MLPFKDILLDHNANLEDNQDSFVQSKYVLGKELGHGEIGRVLISQAKYSHILRAVRVVKISHRGEVDSEKLHKLLSLPKHPNIVKYHDFFLSRKKLSIPMTFCVGSLDSISPLSSRDLDFVLGEVLSGLLFLHGEEVSHGHLKPGSILLDLHGLVKLADVGIKSVSDASVHRSWLAPEQRGLFKKPTLKSDVWDLGVLIVKLLSGNKLPYQHFRSGPHTLLDFLEGFQSTDECRKIVVSCLVIDPDSRPSIQQLSSDFTRPPLGDVGKSLVEALLPQYYNIVEDFQEHLDSVKNLISCSKCHEITDYSSVFHRDDDTFLCDSCLEGHHSYCLNHEECLQCQEIGNKLRRRWFRQQAIEKIREEKPCDIFL